jgi:glycosyltransferase involved in cell wall biosynthesis
LEDCSQDQTQEILREYQCKYPDLIQVHFAETNQNSNKAWAQAIQNAPSQYVALLDGDDYWTSSRKLQLQVDFLNLHQDCSMCFHNALMIYENESQEKIHLNPADQKDTYSITDLLRFNNIAGSSPVYRASACKELPEWIDFVKWGDWVLNLIAAQYGRIAYLNQTLCIYRIHKKGYYSGMSEAERLSGDIEFYQKIIRQVDPEFIPLVDQMLTNRRRQLNLVIK